MFDKTTRVQKSTTKIRKCIRIGCQMEFESVDAAERVCPRCRCKKKINAWSPKQSGVTGGTRIKDNENG